MVHEQWCVLVLEVDRVVAIMQVYQWDEDEFKLVTSSHIGEYTLLHHELQHQIYSYAHSLFIHWIFL
jgi:hypothetical protein